MGWVEILLMDWRIVVVIWFVGWCLLKIGFCIIVCFEVSEVRYGSEVNKVLVFLVCSFMCC